MTITSKNYDRNYDRNYEEKRGFIRMKVETPVTIRCASLGTELTGICRDLSGGGLLVELDATLPLATEVEICIQSQHGHNPMLTARAKVSRVYSRPGSETKPCMLGLEITEVL